MNKKEIELLHYINNYHYKNSKIIYINLKIIKEVDNFYFIEISWNEYQNHKSFHISKDKIKRNIRDSKINELLKN